MPLDQRFIEYLNHNACEVLLYLKAGTKLEGIITAFDSTSMYFTRNGRTQLIYADNIGTIDPVIAIDPDILADLIIG